MPTTQQWRDERATALANAKKIVSKAQSERRDLTPTEQRTVSAATERIEDIDRQAKGRAMVDSVIKLGSSEDNPDHPGGIFTESARDGLVSAVKSRTMFRTDVDTKATLTAGTLLPPSGQTVEPGLYPTSFPLASLFRTEQAGGPTVRYYRLGDATAGVVAEAGLKPDSGVTIGAVDLALTKVATTTKFSDELADDASFLTGFLEQELVAAVITKENSEIITTFGSTSGVLTKTGLATDALDVVADAIAGQESLNGSTPTAVVVHPTVMATLRKVKASTGGDYVLDPLAAGPPTIHGVRVVSTPATAAGTAWVVSSFGVVIYRRGNISAEIGWSGDDFGSNLRTLRVEERFATAVVRPSSLTQVTLT